MTDATPEPQPARPRRLGLLLGLTGGGVALVALIVIGGILIAQAIDRQRALDEHESASAQVDSALDGLAIALAETDEVLLLAADPLVPADAVSALTAEADLSGRIVADADALRDTDPERLGTEEVRALSDDLRDAADQVTETDVAARAALDELMLAVRDAAPGFDEANVDANNDPRIAFRLAAAELEFAPDEQTGETLAAYLEAGRSLAASNAAELAEKAGPLFDARMAVQAYARSIDGGVMLEFDWAPLVNGYGAAGSYGGTSYWVSDHGGYATITLSDSVARMWPGAGVMALVTHEVGHAILSRPDCYDLYFGSEFDLGNEESWATAWAIGMGQTADGSGESIYGRPPEGLIALSQQCR